MEGKKIPSHPLPPKCMVLCEFGGGLKKMFLGVLPTKTLQLAKSMLALTQYSQDTYIYEKKKNPTHI